MFPATTLWPARKENNVPLTIPDPLAPGDLVLDYSTFRLDSATLPQAKAAGCKAVARYSAGAASAPTHPSYPLNKAKLITPAEFGFLTGGGLDIIANDEWYVGRMLAGKSAGRADAAVAGALWQSCGLAKGAVIQVSLDQWLPTARWFLVRSYLTGYAAELAGTYQVGLYAGTPVLQRMLAVGVAKVGWRCMSGSFSNDGLPWQPNTRTATVRAALAKAAAVASPAALWQDGNVWFSGQADESLVVRAPLGTHFDAVRAANKHKLPPPPPPPVAPVAVPSAAELVDASSHYTLVITPEGRLAVNRDGAVERYL